jgi:CheY-like chemotaxis protein
MSELDPQAAVLVTDDDRDAIDLLRQRLTRAGVHRPVQAFYSAEMLIAYLEAAAAPAGNGRPMPCALFLDLSLPRMSGFEALAWIRRRPAFQGIKVIVVSNSSSPADIERAYQLGADVFQMKYPTAETLALIIASPRNVASSQA